MSRSSKASFGSIAVKPPLAYPGQRIGVMGGTFNPPHAGHALISRTALRRLQLDQLWWVVTPGNPLKANSGLPDIAVRIGECREFARDRRMRVTGFEQELGTPFTAATLAYLKRRHPGVRFVWIMGGDGMDTFHRWRRWRRIFAICPIAIVARERIAAHGLKGPALARFPSGRMREPKRLPGARTPAWIYLSARLDPESSSRLRQSLKPSDSAPTVLE